MFYSREFNDSKVKESPYPDIAIPEVSVASFVFERLKKYGDKIAIVSIAQYGVFIYSRSI